MHPCFKIKYKRQLPCSVASSSASQLFIVEVSAAPHCNPCLPLETLVRFCKPPSYHGTYERNTRSLPDTPDSPTGYPTATFQQKRNASLLQNKTQKTAAVQCSFQLSIATVYRRGQCCTSLQPLPPLGDTRSLLQATELPRYVRTQHQIAA